MAKLTKETAEQAETEKSIFEPLPAGTYRVRLEDVDATREGKAGPYWSWTFVVVGGEYEGRKLWNNTTLKEGARFGLKQVFDAFGVPMDTDTDDLCGQIVEVVVGHRVIQEGARAGQVAEQINRVMPAQPLEGEALVPRTGDPEDIF